MNNEYLLALLEGHYPDASEREQQQFLALAARLQAALKLQGVLVLGDDLAYALAETLAAGIGDADLMLDTEN